MASKGVIPAIVIAGALAAAPAWADQEHRGRSRDPQRAEPAGQQAPQARQRERAVPREQGQREQARRDEAQNQQPQQRQQQYQAARRSQAPAQQPRHDVAPRGYDHAVPRQYPRPGYDRDRYPGYASGYGYGYRRVQPRIIRPTIVTVVPYRPYVYRPRWGMNVYYGYNNYYPYGYTPRAYYDPIPGRPYGGLRITGVPPDSQVFADGYYVGIVDDFDGVFQHLNLEVGGHRIEIELPGGYEPALAFDVYVRPGETITYRAGY